jgi:hypothetical protein
MVDPKLELINLPTGKPHISFSEIRTWKECSYRHKLQHVLKIDLGKPGPLMDFGTAVHASCENFLKTRVMDVSIATNLIKSVWEKNKDIEGFELSTIDKFIKEATDILADVPKWMDESFPNWEFIDAEHYLYEPIDGHPHAFKGFIDGVIKCNSSKNKPIIWLIDWKTTSWGWSMDKKTDDMIKSQLILYKNFWTNKTQTNPKDVRCGFVLLKRAAKPGNHCELISVSVGDVTTNRSLKIVNNMLSSVKRGIAIKNRSSCTYCEYKDTPHCT